MSFICKPVLFNVLCKCAYSYIVLANLSGFAFGIYTANISTISFLPLMCGISWNSVSIVRMFCAVLLPLLIAVISVMLSKPGILYCLLFVRAFLRAFCLYGIMITFCYAGWLLSVINLTIPSLVDWLITVIALRHAPGDTIIRVIGITV